MPVFSDGDTQEFHLNFSRKGNISRGFWRIVSLQRISNRTPHQRISLAIISGSNASKRNIAFLSEIQLELFRLKICFDQNGDFL